jgi:hypothetical protein
VEVYEASRVAGSDLMDKESGRLTEHLFAMFRKSPTGIRVGIIHTPIKDSCIVRLNRKPSLKICIRSKMFMESVNEVLSVVCSSSSPRIGQSFSFVIHRDSVALTVDQDYLRL